MRPHLPILFGLPAVLLTLSSIHVTAATAQGEAIMDRDPSETVRVSDPLLRSLVVDMLSFTCTPPMTLNRQYSNAKSARDR